MALDIINIFIKNYYMVDNECVIFILNSCMFLHLFVTFVVITELNEVLVIFQDVTSIPFCLVKIQICVLNSQTIL